MKKEITKADRKEFTIEEIPIGKLEIDYLNPRTIYGDIEELKRQIINAGTYDPLWVRKKGEKYLIFRGARRYKALKRIGEKSIRCRVFHNLTDKETLRLIGSMDTPTEEFNTYEWGKLCKEMKDKGLKIKDIVKRTPFKNRTTIHKLIKIVEEIPEEVIKSVPHGTFSRNTLYQLTQVIEKVGIEDKEKKEKYMKRFLEEASNLNEKQCIKVLENTLEVFELLEGTTDKIKETLVKEFEDKFFTRDLNVKEVKMRLGEEEEGQVPETTKETPKHRLTVPHPIYEKYEKYFEKPEEKMIEVLDKGLDKMGIIPDEKEEFVKKIMDCQICLKPHSRDKLLFIPKDFVFKFKIPLFGARMKTTPLRATSTIVVCEECLEKILTVLAQGSWVYESFRQEGLDPETIREYFKGVRIKK